MSSRRSDSGGITSSRVQQAVYQHRAAKERLERIARQTERQTRDAYLAKLDQMGIAASAAPEVPSAVRLERPMAVADVPGLIEGASVRTTLSDQAGVERPIVSRHGMFEGVAIRPDDRGPRGERSAARRAAGDAGRSGCDTTASGTRQRDAPLREHDHVVGPTLECGSGTADGVARAERLVGRRHRRLRRAETCGRDAAAQQLVARRAAAGQGAAVPSLDAGDARGADEPAAEQRHRHGCVAAVVVAWRRGAHPARRHDRGVRRSARR